MYIYLVLLDVHIIVVKNKIYNKKIIRKMTGFLLLLLIVVLYISLIIYLVNQCKKEVEEFRREWEWRADLYD